MSVRGKGNTRKRRLTAAEFETVVPHLNMSEERIKAARAALVDDEKLEEIANIYGWHRQAVGTAVNTVWTIFNRVKESLRLAEEGGVKYAEKSPEIPVGWSRVTLDVPDYLIDIFKAEIEKAKRAKGA